MHAAGWKEKLTIPRKSHHDLLHGCIVSNWKRDGTGLTMTVAIPINTTATVHVPTLNASGVSESGKPAGQSSGVKYLRMEKGAALFEAGSGHYQFKAS
ncbi:MAG: alpha-L-rhamnosidase C-terminal domain-containing protein [Verrucomicrobiota bacterium]